MVLAHPGVALRSPSDRPRGHRLMASKHRRKVRAERGQSKTRQNLVQLAISSQQAYSALEFEQRKLRFVLDSLVEVLGPEVEASLQALVNEKIAKAKADAEAAKVAEGAPTELAPSLQEGLPAG